MNPQSSAEDREFEATVSISAQEQVCAAATQNHAARNAAGALIGPYELVQLIGEGGMGQVWLADQHQPVRRRVAVKLIKAGMDTREVVARFDRDSPPAD